MNGTVSFCESRRTAFEQCVWWNQNILSKEQKSLNKLVYGIEPSGLFWAEEDQPMVESISNSADFQKTTRSVRISTSDDVYGKIHKNDLVRYCGRIWRVASISLQKEWRKSQFARKNYDGTKLIELVS